MLEELVCEWVSLDEAALRLGLPGSRLRQWLREGRLLALRRGSPPTLQVPAAFLGDGELIKGLPGTVTVLHDSGFSDEEAIRWLFTEDPTLPGRPVDSLAAGRVREVHRRAQAAAL
ncbi:MAG: Rv2175c family DNA-binding protein [Mycobacteriales bacterium]